MSLAPADIQAVQRVGATAPDVRLVQWTPHPLLPVPTQAQIEEVLALPDGVDQLAEYYAARETAIRLSESDAFNYGFEPEHWKDADALLALRILILIVFGGNRAGKSEWAAKRCVQAAMRYGESVIFCMHENETASIALQQKLIWKYLPNEVKALNNQSDSVFKIRYSVAGGFTDRKLVLPNRTEFYFLTYHQKPSDFEGVELGAKQAPSIGVWPDECMSLPWLNMLKLRLASRSAQMIWTYTPVHGMTPTIKDLVGSTARTIKTRASEMLSDRVNLPGLPVGHMPYIQEPVFARARVIYFHSILNPFGNHYENIRALCEGKPSEYVERRAYGYARDVAQRALPYFGPWNIVRVENLPAVGTNYMFVDPAGSRNWATLWVRVTPGNPPRYYIYRDWPAEQRYGEWAVSTEREVSEESRKGWDGDPGPAQNNLGYGIIQYKQMFLREETAAVVVVNGKVLEKDPYRAALVRGIVTTEGTENTEKDGLIVNRDGAPLNVTATGSGGHEEIRERYIDSRAGKNQHAAERGGTCLQDELAREQRNAKSGEVDGPHMVFRLASGVDIQEGLTAVNGLLNWEKEQDLIPGFNEPHLYVAENCKQVIWALENYTGLSGEAGACKDFVDLVRYMALGRLRYVGPGMLRTVGGGSY
jgi:hypothetical protein